MTVVFTEPARSHKAAAIMIVPIGRPLRTDHNQRHNATAAISMAVPFVNRIEPRFFGVPFILAWLTLWVLVTPLFLLAIYRLERRP